MPLSPGVSPPAPGAANFVEFFGHSYFNQPLGTGTLISSITTDQTGEMSTIFAGALNVALANIRNHAYTNSSITQPQRQRCGFARVLAQIQRRRKTYPFVRQGGMYVGNWGINDIGNWGTTTNTQNRYKDGLRAFISRARSSATYLNGDGGPWTHGTNFTAAASTFLNSTSGKAMRATVVNSGTTSRATFTIPLGYEGEPICFAFLCSSGATGVDITWGGTVTGTTGILATVTTTDSASVGGGYGLMTKRYTSTGNGLSAKNAGQTITLTVTRVSAGGEVILDSAWIEASKPDPVVVCNAARLPCRKYNIAFGDVVTTAGSATITSAIAQFATSTDVGNAIIETDAQGAFTAGKTISSVTNATTAVMSGTAAASRTSVEVTLDRTMNGYATNGYSNASFSGATVANHAAADAAVVALNGWITEVVNEFDSMVQIANLDAAVGADDNLPSNVYTWFALSDGLHPNELGNMKCANAIFDAVEMLRASDPIDLSNLELPGIPAPMPGPMRRPRRVGGYYTSAFAAWGATYTAVAGDMFATPIEVTEPAELWTSLHIQQTNAPATSGSNVRVGVYEDLNWTGYPQSLWLDPTYGGAAIAMGTTAGVKNPGGVFSWNIHVGLYWLVFKIESLGTTASIVNQISGPNPIMPAWASVSGGTTSFIGYKLTGQATGILPDVFPAGGTPVASAPALVVLVN